MFMLFSVFHCIYKYKGKYLLRRIPHAPHGDLKEHYHVFAHAREFDFRTGGQEFKDAGIDIELSQIRLHRPQ